MKYVIEFGASSGRFITGDEEKMNYDRIVGIATREGRMRVRMSGDLVILRVSAPNEGKEAVVLCEFDGTMVEAVP